MEALEIESQTDQAPLASRRRYSPQGELAEAEYLFDDPDHWFDRAFACPVDRFAQRSPELVGHLDLRTGILRRRVWQGREALLPASRDRSSQRPALLPRGCRSSMEWPQAWVRPPGYRSDDWRGPIPR